MIAGSGGGLLWVGFLASGGTASVKGLTGLRRPSALARNEMRAAGVGPGARITASHIWPRFGAPRLPPEELISLFSVRLVRDNPQIGWRVKAADVLVTERNDVIDLVLNARNLGHDFGFGVELLYCARCFSSGVWMRFLCVRRAALWHSLQYQKWSSFRPLDFENDANGFSILHLLHRFMDGILNPPRPTVKRPPNQNRNLRNSPPLPAA